MATDLLMSDLDRALALAARVRSEPALLPHGELVLRMPSEAALRATYAARLTHLETEQPELSEPERAKVAGGEALDHVRARTTAMRAARSSAQPRLPAQPKPRQPTVQRPTGDEPSAGRRLDSALTVLAKVDGDAHEKWRGRAARLVEETEELLRDSTRRRLELR